MLLEIEILLPIMNTCDRDRAEDRAASLFGGYTWRGIVTGGYRMPDGAHERDACHVLCVAVDTMGDIALAVAYAREMGNALGQHSVMVRLPTAGFCECVECGGGQ